MSESIITAVTNRLDSLTDPYTGHKMSAGRALKSVQVSDDKVVVVLRKGYPMQGVADQLSEIVKGTLQNLPFENRDLEVVLEQDIISHSVQQGVQAVDGV